MSVQELSAPAASCPHAQGMRLTHARSVLRTAELISGSGAIAHGMSEAMPRKRRLTRAERMSGTARAVREQLELADQRCEAELGMHSESRVATTIRGRPADQSLDCSADDLLSSFLTLGVVHEICGLFVGARMETKAEATVEVTAEVTTGSACDRSVLPTAAGDAVSTHGSDADVHAGIPHRWPSIVPHGCLIHIMKRLVAGQWARRGIGRGSSFESNHEGDHEGNHGRGILWIGNRMHPDPRALRRAMEGDGRGQDAALLRRSTLVFDASDGSRQDPDAVVANRLWCAEQALRMRAADAVIVDGTGFGTLAWRRLQLAAAASAAAHPDDPNGAAALVLVVTPPSASRPRGCAATTRWSVHAASRADQGFHWRMQLDSVRGGVATSPRWSAMGDMRARLEARELFVDISVARPAFGVEAWNTVSGWGCGSRAHLGQQRTERATRAHAHSLSEFAASLATGFETGGAACRHARSA